MTIFELYSANAPKDGRSAFETSLRPFVHKIPRVDPPVPDAASACLLVPNAEAGLPSFAQLAQALLELEACFHNSSKSAAFVACYKQWRSQVRSEACPLNASHASAPVPPTPCVRFVRSSLPACAHRWTSAHRE